MLSIVGGAFSDDISIDLGTANTLVHVAGRGIIIEEPSIVAVVDSGAGREVLAVGAAARGLDLRGPDAPELIRPLREGVIADFIATEALLRNFIARAKSRFGFRRPRILVCVPAGATAVERRAVYETAMAAGARRVHLVEEPVAASLGAGVAIDDPAASMVVDIGGGTTDVAVLSLGDIVLTRSVRVAGNAFDEAIVRYVRRVHALAIGNGSAERIKIEAGTAATRVNGRSAEVHIRGRDVIQQRAKNVILRPHDVAEALQRPISDIAELVRRTIEDLPVGSREDIMRRGILLTGGGALLDGLDNELTRRLGIVFKVPPAPTHCVVMGTAIMLSTLDVREHLLVGV